MRQKVKHVDYDFLAEFKKVAKAFAAEMIKTMPETAFAFETKKRKQAGLEHEIFKDLKEVQEEIRKGAEAMLHECIRQLQIVPKANIDAVIEDIRKLTKKNTTTAIMKSWHAGISLKDHFGISSETMEAFYQAARSLYEQRRLEEAFGAFFMLTLLDSGNYAFWVGRGAASQLLGKYEQALFAYAAAAHTNPFDPMGHFWAAKCYELIHEKALAINSLELALFVIKETKGDEAFALSIKNEIARLQNE